MVSLHLGWSVEQRVGQRVQARRSGDVVVPRRTTGWLGSYETPLHAPTKNHGAKSRAGPRVMHVHETLAGPT